MHIPVLLNEMLTALSPQENGVYVDATFGAGGYTKAILNSTNCKVIALDRDATVIPNTLKLKEEFGDRFEFHNTVFSKINEVVKEKVDGIVADFGVSSMQLDTPERGFSFLKEGVLDMRMGNENLQTAKQIINQMPEPKLVEIISKYGEERLAKKIASFIARARSNKEINTTTELASIIYEAYGSEVRYTKIHPATKTFQALRIYINEELREIEILLEQSVNLLKSQGRLVCISFHALEDSIVKNFLGQNSKGKQKTNKYAQFSKSSPQEEKSCAFEFISKDIIIPSKEEVESNIRSRSARLRYAIRS